MIRKKERKRAEKLLLPGSLRWLDDLRYWHKLSFSQNLQHKEETSWVRRRRQGEDIKIHFKKWTFYIAIEFKEEFIVKKGLIFEVSGKK